MPTSVVNLSAHVDVGRLDTSQDYMNTYHFIAFPRDVLSSFVVFRLFRLCLRDLHITAFNTTYQRFPLRATCHSEYTQ